MRNGFSGLALFLLGFVSITFADQATITEREISPGVTYLHKTVKSVPWSVHALRIERNRPDVRLVTTMPGGEYIGLTRLSDQVRFIPHDLGEPIAAINGDFFRWQTGPYQGDPSGLFVKAGELVSGPTQSTNRPNERGASALWIDEQGEEQIGLLAPRFTVTWPNSSTTTPFTMNQERGENDIVLYTHHAGLSTKTTNGVELVVALPENRSKLEVGERYQVIVREKRGPNTLLNSNILVLSVGPKIKLPEDVQPGTTLELSTRTSPNVLGCKEAVGGGPLLVRQGKIPKMPRDDVRHPRAALGRNKDYLFFVVVDGRRAGVSDGMTYRELAEEMVSWNCTEAMNIDGGASAMLWINGQIMNQPSENRERPNANSLFVLKRAVADRQLKTASP